MASATAFLPRIVALGRGAAQTQLRSVLQQCNVSKPFVVTDKNLEALTRSVLDSAEMSGEIYADEVDEPTSDRVDAMAAALASSNARRRFSNRGRQSLRRGEAGRRAFRKRRQMPRLQGARPDGHATSSTDGRRADDGRHGGRSHKVRRRHRFKTGEKMLCAGAAFVPAACVVGGSAYGSVPRRTSALLLGLTATVRRRRRCALSRHGGRDTPLSLSDGFHRRHDALRGVGRHLRSAVDDEAEGRDGMARAAFLAGVSFSVSSVTLIHGMSRPLGARFHLAHGRSNAVLMSGVTAYSLEGARERYAQCSEALGLAGDLPTALGHLASSLACRRSATLY